MATPSFCCLCKELDIDDFNDVSLSCQSVSPQWATLAKYLNIGVTIVEGIEVIRGGRDTEWCLDELLKAWLRRPSTAQPSPSWRILCDAVAKIDRSLSEKIWSTHTTTGSAGCELCSSTVVREVKMTHGSTPLTVKTTTPIHTLRHTPVAMAVQQEKAAEAAKKLENGFEELMDFLITEISSMNVDKLRYQISKHFEKEEGTIDEEIEKHLTKIEDYNKPNAILNYFRRHRFIGYVNYSLVKVFQQLAKSPLLDKRIEQYEKDYQCFLELSLSQIHNAFQQCPDLRPDYPAGIPKFTIQLQSEWDGKSMLDLKEFLKKCFTNSDCVDQLMITDIRHNCIIITYAVLPHIARKVMEYLTNDDVIMSMKKEGISIEISKQLIKYKEEMETTSMEHTSGTLKTNLTSYNSQATGILSIKHDWDDTATVTDITSGYGDSETNEYSRLVELKDDVTVKETVDIYEKVVDMLRKRIKSLENQFVTHKQMMIELDNTRDELRRAKRSQEEELEVSMKKRKEDDMELDNTRDELKTKQSLSVVQEELVSAKKREEDQRKNVKLNEDLCDAAENGDTDHIEMLIKSGANVNTRSSKLSSKPTPLHIASSNGHGEAVNLLILLGANINAKDDRSYTPLHVASSCGHSDVVNILLSHGATVNEKDIGGDTPLHEASLRGHSDVVNILLSHGATVNEKDIGGWTPLHNASVHGHSDVVNILLSHGATVNEKNNRGSTPLHKASLRRHSDVVNILLSHGATVNEEDKGGNTPLHYASRNAHSDTVNVLLSHGAIVNSVNKIHQTPLHQCLTSIHSRDNIIATAELLISHGADLYYEDKDGNSPVMMATVLGYEDLMLSHGVSEDIISKYRLPSGWEAKYRGDSIQYTNTITRVYQDTHPSLSDSTH